MRFKDRIRELDKDWYNKHKEEIEKIASSAEKSIGQKKIIYADMQKYESEYPYSSPEELKVKHPELYERFEHIEQKMTERERIICYYRICGYTQREIGKKIGLTHQRIGQIIKAMKHKYRKHWI